MLMNKYCKKSTCKYLVLFIITFVYKYLVLLTITNCYKLLYTHSVIYHYFYLKVTLNKNSY